MRHRPVPLRALALTAAASLPFALSLHLETDDIPIACANICGPIVEVTSKCETDAPLELKRLKRRKLMEDMESRIARDSHEGGSDKRATTPKTKRTNARGTSGSDAETKSKSKAKSKAKEKRQAKAKTCAATQSGHAQHLGRRNHPLDEAPALPNGDQPAQFMTIPTDIAQSTTPASTSVAAAGEAESPASIATPATTEPSESEAAAPSQSSSVGASRWSQGDLPVGGGDGEGADGEDGEDGEGEGVEDTVDDDGEGEGEDEETDEAGGEEEDDADTDTNTNGSSASPGRKEEQDLEEQETQCVCRNESFDVQRLSGLCSDCIVQMHDDKSPMKALMYYCNFTAEESYEPSMDGLAFNVNVEARSPSGASGRLASGAAVAGTVVSFVASVAMLL